MPFKVNAVRRHHIPRQRHQVTNTATYDAALRQRGSPTVWFTDAAIAGWKAQPRTTRGGRPLYPDLAIATALTLRAVFRLALRQTEGLTGSVLARLGLDLAVPDHSTLSRRSRDAGGAGAAIRHGARALPGGQHGIEALRFGRATAGEAWGKDAPCVAQAAHRRGRRHQADPACYPHHR